MSDGKWQWQVALALGAVYLLWGSIFLAIRFSVETLPPFLMAGVRLTVAGGLLYVWSLLQGARQPTRRHWRSALEVGGLMLFLSQGGVAWAAQMVPSGFSALIIATVPAWMVLMDWARPGGVRPSISTVVGVAVGLGGVALLMAPGAAVGGADGAYLLGGAVLN